MPAAYVFSRQLSEELGGFVSFDQGWHSDDATWALFGAQNGIKPIKDAFIRWRLSNISITPAMLHDHFRSTQAELAFLSWVDANSARLGLTDSDIRELTDDSICWSIYHGIAQISERSWLPTAWRTARLLRRYSSKSLLGHLFRFARARVTRLSM